MEIITIESKAFKELLEKLNALSDYVYSMKPLPKENDDESWVDSRYLRFSEDKRMDMQRLRTNGKISYTNLGGKNYYLISQVKKLLKENVIKSTEEHVHELAEHHKRHSFDRRIRQPPGVCVRPGE